MKGYADIQVTVSVRTGEIREYDCYDDFKKDFRFFWSGGERYEDNEEMFETMIEALRKLDRHGANFEIDLNGIKEKFTLKKW